MNKKATVIIVSLIGILFVGLSFVYFITPANHLPHMLPGYEINTMKAHTKHGIGSLLLGMGCFVLAWFQSGSKK